uniref:POP1 domain-containing protein n=1 Tax=Panagrellus redivivus TaxID=6233 RepID=A0A7E4V7P2_PANRE
MAANGLALNELFPGEEAFVLQLPRQPPSTSSSSTTPFVLEGWEDVPRQTMPINKPSGYFNLRQVLRRRIQALQAARQKAPAFGRVVRMLAALQQKWMAVKDGVKRTVGVIFGGGRKRGAEESLEPADSTIQVKRRQTDEAHDGSTDADKQEEANVVDFDVPMPDFDVFEDFGYGQAEDEAATEAILAVDFDFNADNVHPDGNQVHFDVNEVENPPPAVPMDIDEEPLAMADAQVGEVGVAAPVEVVLPAEVEPPVNNIDQSAPRRKSRATKASPKAPAQRKSASKAKRGRRPRQDPLEVVETQRGDGFEIQRRANGTARLIGTFPGVDYRQSSLLTKAAQGGVSITAPERSYIKQVSAGTDFVMLLTSKGRLMMLGSNAFGQLGCRRRRPRMVRVASQSLGWMQRGPIGMASIEITSIEAKGHEARAWAKKVAYRCGAADNSSRRQPIMKRCKAMDK